MSNNNQDQKANIKQIVVTMVMDFLIIVFFTSAFSFPLTNEDSHRQHINDYGH